MTYSIEKHVDGIVVRECEHSGLMTLELCPEWEDQKRRLTSFVEMVSAQFSPGFLRSKNCLGVFGYTSVRNNKAALRSWLVTNYESQLDEEPADMRLIAEKAFTHAADLLEDAGIREVME